MSEDLRRQDDRLLGELSAKIDQWGRDIKDVKESIKWQNGRVRKLEGWRWFLVGCWSATTGLVYVLWSAFKTYLSAVK